LALEEAYAVFGNVEPIRHEFMQNGFMSYEPSIKYVPENNPLKRKRNNATGRIIFVHDSRCRRSEAYLDYKQKERRRYITIQFYSDGVEFTYVDMEKRKVGKERKNILILKNTHLFETEEIKNLVNVLVFDQVRYGPHIWGKYHVKTKPVMHEFKHSKNPVGFVKNVLRALGQS
jgi:hypothetical protein